MSLRFLTYNIGGLFAKLDNADLVNYVKSFDVICLTETYTEAEFETDLFIDFNIYMAKAKKTVTPGEIFRGCCCASP